MLLRVVHIIAPMKIKYLKSILAVHRRRVGVALLFLLCLNLAVFSPSFAQLKNQRHVTGLQLGAAAEGSRVTVVADSPLNDYEAFRRGDRFYVRIPLADFMSGLPQFRGDGFESVQVQKSGDSLIVSFKLQPGATARINQYGNRLDVVFSAPNRSNNVAGPTSNPAGNLLGPGAASLRNTSERSPDAAGPTPPGSRGSREGVVSEAGSEQGTNAWSPSFQNNRRGSAGANRRAGNTDALIATASPVPSPATTFSPAPSSAYTPLTTTTPVNTNAGSTQAVSSSWSNRKAATVRWMSANRLATLLGALILLSLILYLAAALRRRKKDAVQTKSPQPKVQPKFSPDEKLDELPSARADEPLAIKETAIVPPPEAQAAAAGLTHNRVLTRPTIVSQKAAGDEERAAGELSTDQEEREVFEL
jgi:hypothetical protein